MKKLLFIFSLALISQSAFCQHHVFMGLLENRAILDTQKLNHFLRENYFIKTGDTYTKDHSALSTINRDYRVSITTDNNGFATYKTNNLTEYNTIKQSVNDMTCNGNHCFIHREHNIVDVDVTFLGFNTSTNEGTIRIYQTPRRVRKRYLIH